MFRNTRRLSRAFGLSVDLLEDRRLLSATTSPVAGISAAISSAAARSSTTTLLAAVPNPVQARLPVTLVATVVPSATSVGQPSGTVSFVVDGTIEPPAPLTFQNGSMVAVFTTTTLPAGKHSITAVYAGDTKFLASATAQPLTLQVVSTPFKPTMSVLSAVPASNNATQPVTFVAGIVPAPGLTGQPSGSVVFTVDGVPTGLTPIQVINNQSVALYTVPNLPLGIHNVTASYQGDGLFGPSDAAPLNYLTQSPNLVGTSIALSTVPTATSLGDPLTFVAAVLPIAGSTGSPTGTVNLVIDNLYTYVLPLQPVNGYMVAQLTTTRLVGGNHSAVAYYGGDPRFSGSVSGTANFRVGEGQQFASNLALTLIPGAPRVGQPLDFVVTITPAGRGATQTPTGWVVFSIDGVNQPAVAVGPVSGQPTWGRAILVRSNLKAGLHRVTVSYTGDSHYYPSDTTSNPKTFTIRR